MSGTCLAATNNEEVQQKVLEKEEEEADYASTAWRPAGAAKP